MELENPGSLPSRGPATNPYNLKNNCVFVTMAHLLNMNINQFLHSIETMQPAENENGISETNMLQMLKDTKRNYLIDRTGMQGNTFDYCIGMCERWQVYKIGICYRVRDGLFHCMAFERLAGERVGEFQDAQEGLMVEIEAPDNIAIVFAFWPQIGV